MGRLPVAAKSAQVTGCHDALINETRGLVPCLIFIYFSNGYFNPHCFLKVSH